MNINATLFAEMVVFIGFVGLTRLYVWPPLMDIIEQRQKDIAQGVEDARQGSVLLRDAEDKRHQILQDAKKQSSGILNQAESEAESIIHEATAEAKRLLDAHAANAKIALDKQTYAAKKGLEGHTLAYVQQVLTKVMGELPDMPHLENMVAKATGEIDGQG